MELLPPLVQITGAACGACRPKLAELRSRLESCMLFGSALVFQFQFSGKKADLYSMLWALVFGLATLNILSLGARRVDPKRGSGLSIGETLAIMIVVMSIFLLTWEMLNLFKVFPIKLRPH